MSNNNNNDNGAVLGLALVFAALYILGAIIYALACFVAVIFTICALLSWRKPFFLFGHEICGPRVAHFYMYSAIGGAWGAAVFAFFCAALFDIRITDDAWFYIFSGGYAFMPWAAAGLVPNGYFEEPQAQTHDTVIEHTPPSLPPAREPFTYAHWDDDAPDGNSRG